MDTLPSIWKQAQTGDRVGARRKLLSILRANPEDTQAWLLMAVLCDDPTQQADCCRKVLTLDPQNPHAAAMLQKLHPPAPDVKIPDLFESVEDIEPEADEPATFIQEELTRYVIHELANEADHDTLIRYICENGDMAWPQAEAFVARVALEHEQEIVKRRSPFMLVLSVATLVGGVLIALVSGYALWTLFSPPALLRPDYAIYGLITGLGMIGGGLIGIVRLVKSLREASVV
ncbi:MAG TPA: hypothetical protein PLJ78_08360 [Anaerolineae bacterium]|nr:hypothetical protein [Anaerolineae bacterium]HQK13938.1 hypothetical protein [Anaerolineae bacterium]